MNATKNSLRDLAEQVGRQFGEKWEISRGPEGYTLFWVDATEARRPLSGAVALSNSELLAYLQGATLGRSKERHR